MESLPSNIPSIREVHKAYHKDKELTEYIGKLLHHKVTNKTKSPKPFFRFLAHRLKYGTNKNYKEAFDNAARVYIAEKKSPKTSDKEPIPTSSSPSTSENESLKDHAVKGAKRLARKLKKKEKIENLKGKIAEQQQKIELKKAELDSAQEAVSSKEVELEKLRTEKTAIGLSDDKFARREQLVNELSKEKMPEWGSKMGRKLGRVKDGVKWEKDFKLGDEASFLESISSVESKILEMKLGKHRKSDHRARIDTLKPKLEELKTINEALPEKYRTKTTKSLNKRLSRLNVKIQKADQRLTTKKERKDAFEAELKPLNEEMTRLESELEQLTGKKEHKEEPVPEVAVESKHRKETEDETKSYKATGESTEAEEFKSSESIEMASSLETKSKKKRRKKPELTGSTGHVRAKSLETEKVIPLEAVEPSTGPVQNEHTQQFLALLRENLSEMPKLAELVQDQLNRFYTFYGKDCCEGLEKGKKGVYTLKFAHPMQVFISEPFELLGIPKPGSPQASDKKEDKALLEIANQFLRNGMAITLNKKIEFTLQNNKFVLKSGCSVAIRKGVVTMSCPAIYSIDLEGKDVSIEGGFWKLKKKETFTHKVIAKSLEQSNIIMGGVEILGKDAKPTDVLKENQSKRKRRGLEEDVE